MTKLRIIRWVVLILALVQGGESAYSAQAGDKPQIESGFNLLYQLKFAEARVQFMDWLRTNPDDPLGYAAIAGSYLFEEFNEHHVLTSDFFLNDDRLFKGIEGRPDEGRRAKFQAAIQKGRKLALKQLQEDPQDANALFALTISAGMRADFAAIIERRQMESLSWIKEAEVYAKRLLALRPEDADALLSLGAANYIIGGLPRYKRLFLWFDRFHGDKRLGMQQLRITAEKGHYLKPFAEIFLALAAMREKQDDLARSQLRDLALHFPENPLYRAELARLDNQHAPHGGQ